MESSRLTQGRLRAVVALSLGGALLLLALEAAVPPPEGLPFLHPTMNALYSCAHFTAAYGVGVYWQWREGSRGAAAVIEVGVEGGDDNGPPPREKETKKRR